METIGSLPLKYVVCICIENQLSLEGEWMIDTNVPPPLLNIGVDNNNQILLLKINNLSSKPLRKINQKRNRFDIYMYLSEAISFRDCLYSSCSDILKGVPQSQDYRSVSDPREFQEINPNSPPIRIAESGLGNKVKVQEVRIGYEQFELSVQRQNITSSQPFIILEPEYGNSKDPSPRLHIGCYSQFYMKEPAIPGEMNITMSLNEVGQLIVAIDSVFTAFKNS